MNRSLKLGTAFGIGIYVHFSFLLLPAYILFVTWGQLEPAMVVTALVLMVAVFGCVVLHELGHALMARYFGIQTRDITLYPIGGVARLERMTERPHEELLIALAGPAVNVIIAVPLAFLVVLSGAVFSWQQLFQSAVGSFLLQLLVANVFLVVFNMIPAFPMDGGRVLRAILWMPLGRLQATEVAVYLGMGIAVLMAVGVVIGMVFGVVQNPMLLVICAFVFFAGQMELAGLRRLEARRQRGEVLEPVPVKAESVIIEEPRVAADFTGAVWDARARAWVLWHHGRPVGAFGNRME